MIGFAGRRLDAWAVVAVVIVAGCVDVGLAERNTPEDVAAKSDWSYRVYDAAAPAELVLGASESAGHTTADAPVHWLRSAEHVAVPERLLRPIGAAGGATVYALVWDDEPYDQLFASTARPGSYHPMHPVLPPATPHEAGAEADADHGAH